MTIIGKLMFIICSIASIITMNYKLIWFGVFLLFVDICFWLNKTAVASVSREKITAKGKNAGLSDHFIYHNLFNKGGK